MFKKLVRILHKKKPISLDLLHNVGIRTINRESFLPIIMHTNEHLSIQSAFAIIFLPEKHFTLCFGISLPIWHRNMPVSPINYCVTGCIDGSI